MREKRLKLDGDWPFPRMSSKHDQVSLSRTARGFGFFWMNERVSSRQLTISTEHFNRIVIDLAPRSASSARYVQRWTVFFRYYGGLTAYERRDHSSDQNPSLAKSAFSRPWLSLSRPVFLSISTFMIAGLVARAVYMPARTNRATQRRSAIQGLKSDSTT